MKPSSSNKANKGDLSDNTTEEEAATKQYQTLRDHQKFVGLPMLKLRNLKINLLAL